MERLRRPIPYLFLLCFLAGCGREESGKNGDIIDPTTEGLQIGRHAPDFTGEEFTGKRFSLSDNRGKVVVLSFWSVNCPYCHMLVPHERALVDRMKGKPFAFIGINCDRSRDEADKTAYQLGMTWPCVWDRPPGRISERYLVDAFPAIFVIDHEGVIRAKYLTDPHKLEKLVEQLVAEAEKAKTAG